MTVLLFAADFLRTANNIWVALLTDLKRENKLKIQKFLGNWKIHFSNPADLFSILDSF